MTGKLLEREGNIGGQGLGDVGFYVWTGVEDSQVERIGPDFECMIKVKGCEREANGACTYEGDIQRRGLRHGWK